MASSKDGSKSLYVQTPLMRSKKLSDKTGFSIWLKLENLQNSGSFKARGIGQLCNKAVQNGCTRFISSSGGNAGLAAAFCAQQLGIPITVVVPESTPTLTIRKLKEEGAVVEVKGQAWDEANERAKELVAASKDSCLIHPFDHPDIWEGHASLVTEVQQQLQGIKPDLFVLAVGGGGLMNGVLEGLHHIGWEDVPVVAMETQGAHSFAACVQANAWVELNEITSIAKTLGAKRVSKRSYEWLSLHPILSHVVTDKEAVTASIKFADDHRMLVSPACGAALAAVYGAIISDLQKAHKLPMSLSNVVVVVCGGNEVSLDLIQSWKETYGITA
ncbi:hypothetical protein EMCRGX_G025076 [Ephydatia muelleri]|eukprot:Em0015g1250a